jgi:SAM-dependent methyltransferase
MPRVSEDPITLLCCPVCRASLVKQENGYSCPSCGRSFPQVCGVLRSVDQSNYADSFGYQWRQFDKTQLDDASRNFSEPDFVKKAGLKPEDLKGKLVLDVGCGMGRFAEVATRWGARVVGIDLSAAAEVAVKNLSDRDFCRFPGGCVCAPFLARNLRLHLQHGRAPSHSGLRKGFQGTASVSEIRRDHCGLALQRLQQVVSIQRSIQKDYPPHVAANLASLLSRGRAVLLLAGPWSSRASNRRQASRGSHPARVPH